MFQPIDYKELVPGTKYKIEGLSCLFLGVAFRHTNVWYLKFYKIGDLQRFTFFSQHCQFYQFISQQPQWNMERRSVNMIVRRLIGDDHFEW
jgi:hypothetical protein